ncbi:phage holin family protein [Stakelama marina]|uniref:Phage holin family protein n=1 Tax=Stakelama marina TaxID=2826939 RepID=A0A8T4IAU5_9SPHN|nr:phage holin family protein [Stakelama marina]MBR0551501.1 phage holin family protein [Stakelama marina]
MQNNGPEEPGLGTQLAQLARETRDWARAEGEYYKALARDRANDVKLALALGVAGATLAYAALIALLVGAIIILMPVVGAIWAVVIVTGIALAMSALMVRAALRFFQNAKRPATPRDKL